MGNLKKETPGLENTWQLLAQSYIRDSRRDVVCAHACAGAIYESSVAYICI